MKKRPDLCRPKCERSERPSWSDRPPVQRQGELGEGVAGVDLSDGLFICRMDCAFRSFNCSIIVWPGRVEGEAGSGAILFHDC